MEGLGQVLLSCLELFQIELSLDGFTFSLWQIFLWLIVAGAVVYLIVKWSDDNWDTYNFCPAFWSCASC